MSTLTVIECDEDTCKNNKNGYCSAKWVEIQSQECMTYEYDGVYKEADE